MIRQFIACLLLLLSPAAAQLPDATIPAPLGVNIHFTDEQPGEVEQIAAAGIRLIRMDFSWTDVEKERGQYTFDAYDRLMLALDRHKIRPIFILDYAHPFYDDNRSPDTDEGRAAFARFAAAGARHFRGRGVIWEIYNEPNIFPFWRPTPNTGDYIKLALATAEAIRAVDPAATVIGPACSGIDFEFLQACFDAGLLKHFAGVSVHPYRQRDPETAEADYRKLRRLIAERSSPPAADSSFIIQHSSFPPILSGEWGYSDIWAGYDRRKQAAMLARQWLFNLSQHVPVNIWYDWRDDGEDPKEPEHHFGIVDHHFKEKPAYAAARTLSTQLSGMRFCRRIWTGFEHDWVLLFAGPDAASLVAWTTAGRPRDIVVPVGEGEFAVTTMLGETKEENLRAYQGRVPLTLSAEPIYVRTNAPDDVLKLLAEWTAPKELSVKLDALTGKAVWRAEVRNPLSEPVLLLVTTDPPPEDAIESLHRTVAPGDNATFDVELPVSRVAGAQHAEVYLSISSFPLPIAQRVAIECVNPIIVELRPVTMRDVMVHVSAPAGEGFQGKLRVASEYLRGGEATLDVMLRRGGEPFGQLLKLEDSRPEPMALSAEWIQADASIPAALVRYRDMSLSANQWQASVDGDEKVAAAATVQFVEAPDAPAKARVARIDYEFAPGWRFARLHAKQLGGPIVDRPARLGLWVKGDGSGNILRCRFVDAADQTFQPDGPKLNFTDWRYIEFPLDGSRAGHWGGDQSGRVQFPVKVETLLLIDSAARQKTGGSVLVAGACVVEEGGAR